jgi:hypothetical protein
VNWWHCASVYLPAIKYALVALLVAQLAGDVQSHTTQIKVGGYGWGRGV